MSGEVDPGLGWGTAAPVLFFVEAFRTTADEHWLSAARAGTRWMDAHLDESAQKWAGCGLLTGVGGWAVVLHELAEAAGEEQGDWLLAQAEAAPGGIRWSLGRAYEAERPDDRRRFPNFAHGAAGIAFFLARLAQVTGEQRFLDASLAATGGS